MPVLTPAMRAHLTPEQVAGIEQRARDKRDAEQYRAEMWARLDAEQDPCPECGEVHDDAC